MKIHPTLVDLLEMIIFVKLYTNILFWLTARFLYRTEVEIKTSTAGWLVYTCEDTHIKTHTDSWLRSVYTCEDTQIKTHTVG